MDRFAKRGQDLQKQLTVEATRWATPTAGDAKASGRSGYTAGTMHLGETLTDQTIGSRGRRDRETPRDGESGSPPAVLNPQFVEALMGLPTGWTDFDALETASFRRWLRAHGEL
jgi:hypothetical protein